MGLLTIATLLQAFSADTMNDFTILLDPNESKAKSGSRAAVAGFSIAIMINLVILPLIGISNLERNNVFFGDMRNVQQQPGQQDPRNKDEANVIGHPTGDTQHNPYSEHSAQTGTAAV